MAETIDTTVTTTEPTTDPVTETTPSEGTEPEGKEAKPESKFLQRLGKLLGIGGDDGDGDGDPAAPEGGKKTEPSSKDGKTYTDADLQARIDAAKHSGRQSRRSRRVLPSSPRRSVPRRRPTRPAMRSHSSRRSSSPATSGIRR